MALERIGFGTFRARQRAARAEGRHLGSVSRATYEGTGIGPYEGAHVRSSRAQRLRRDRPHTQGQGTPDDVRPDRGGRARCHRRNVTVVTGDTSRFNWGAGTFASRALVTAGNAVATAPARCGTSPPPRRDLLEVAPPNLECGTARSASRRPRPALALGASATVANPNPLRVRQGGAEAALRLVKPARCRAPRRRGAGPGSPRLYAPPQADVRERLPRRRGRGRRRDRRRALSRYVVQHDCAGS